MRIYNIYRGAALPIGAIGTFLKNNALTLSRELYGGTFLSTLNFSSLSKESYSDPNLLQVIESEIRCAEEELEDNNKLDNIPFGFPFEIEDEPGKKVITLRSQYQDEDVIAMVRIPTPFRSHHPTVTMACRLNKEVKQQCLWFGCVAYPDEMIIEFMKVEKPTSQVTNNSYFGPLLSSLDANLQKMFSKYLQDRGIRPSTTNFLYEYLIKKDSKEYLMWLKNLKHFIQN